MWAGLGRSNGSLCGVLKDTLGAGVMDKPPLAHNALRHWDFAPGAHAIRDVGFREWSVSVIFQRGFHGRHSGERSPLLSNHDGRMKTAEGVPHI